MIFKNCKTCLISFMLRIIFSEWRSFILLSFYINLWLANIHCSMKLFQNLLKLIIFLDHVHENTFYCSGSFIAQLHWNMNRIFVVTDEFIVGNLHKNCNNAKIFIRVAKNMPLYLVTVFAFFFRHHHQRRKVITLWCKKFAILMQFSSK